MDNMKSNCRTSDLSVKPSIRTLAKPGRDAKFFSNIIFSIAGALVVVTV